MIHSLSFRTASVGVLLFLRRGEGKGAHSWLSLESKGLLIWGVVSSSPTTSVEPTLNKKEKKEKEKGRGHCSWSGCWRGGSLSGKREGAGREGWVQADTLDPFSTCSCQAAPPSYMDFEHFHKSSELVQIISCYLTALFPWLLKVKVNQSLTAQNLAGTLNKDVHERWGQGWGSAVISQGLLPIQAGFQKNTAGCRNCKMARLYCRMNDQPSGHVTVNKRLWKGKGKRGEVKGAMWLRKPRLAGKTLAFLEGKQSKTGKHSAV